MSAFAEQVTIARQSLRGRRTDRRVHKAAGKPAAQQIDQPAGLGNTPPAQQAHDMYEGIDLTSPNMLNDMYQRYGPAMIHAAVRKHSAKSLKDAAGHPDLHPRVRTLLHAAAAVRKAFEGGNPMAANNPAGSYPNSTPSISIPARPKHGGPGNPENTYPATVGARSHSAPGAAANPGAVTHQPQTAGGASHGGSTDQPVGRQWVYSPSPKNPVGMPMDKQPGGVGDNDQGYPDRTDRGYLGQPSVGDLVNFNGPGGSKFQAKVVQLTTGAVIGEFAGQNCVFPLDSITPHNVGGSDHGPANAPAGLTDRRGPRPVGVGNKSPEASEFKPGGSNVTKDQRSAIYSGGQPMSARTGAAAGVHTTQPDAGTPVQPYNERHPYSAEEGAVSGAAPGNNVNGYLTAKERMLIAHVINARSPVATETAALKALNANAADDGQRAILRKALKDHALVIPAMRTDLNAVIGKLA